MMSAKTIAGLSLFCLVAICHRAPASPPLNILMIISDDQAWTDYGFMGHPVIKTPNLDQLARESVLFRRGYVPTALCRPSLATLLTGHYAKWMPQKKRVLQPGERA